MKRIAIILTALSLSACATGYVNQEKVEPDEEFCGMIKSVANLVPIYVAETDKKTDVAFTLPTSVPVDVEVRNKVNETLHFLTSKFSQRVTIYRTAMFTNIMLRNAAPCKTDNITRSWDNLDLIVKELRNVEDDTVEKMTEIQSTDSTYTLGDEKGIESKAGELIETIKERRNAEETTTTEEDI